MKYCTKCGNEYEDSMARCPKDGGELTGVATKTEPLPHATPPNDPPALDATVPISATERLAGEIEDMLFGVCPSCDRVFDGSVETCPHDGSRLIEHSMLTRGTILRDSQTAAMDLRKYCPRCNERFALDIDDCENCGAVLQVPTFSGQRLGEGALRELDSVIAGKYRLLEKIGVGGFSSVFLAKHESLGKRFAVKLLRSMFSRRRGFRNRFHEEALKLSRLEDDNIVKVVDFGESGNCQYMVTEFVDGTDLGSIIYDEKAQLLRAAKIMRQVASALAEAHAKNIVHLDLKPANILVTQRRGRDSVRVIDFGIAEIYTDASASRQEAVVGTCSYMAPEQWRREPLDPRTDIYSFGVIFYEFLAGRRPFRESCVSDFEKAHCEKVPPPLRRLRPDVPPELEKLVHRCLEKDRSKRIASATKLESVLDAYVRREENVLGRAFGRIAAAILFLSIVALSVWGVWEWRRDKTKPTVDQFSVTGAGLVRSQDGTYETRSDQVLLSVAAAYDRDLDRIVLSSTAMDWERVVAVGRGSTELPLRLGINTVTAYAVDKAGNRSDQTSLSIRRQADRELRIVAPLLAQREGEERYTKESAIDLTLDEFFGVELRVLCSVEGAEPHFDLKIARNGKGYTFEGQHAALQNSPASGEKARVVVSL